MTEAESKLHDTFLGSHRCIACPRFKQDIEYGGHGEEYYLESGVCVRFNIDVRASDVCHIVDDIRVILKDLNEGYQSQMSLTELFEGGADGAR